MPVVPVNGIDLYYEESGSGEPLLLIMGWGGNAATWLPQVPGLAREFRVITFDNRGAGRSTAPGGPYTVAQLADDATGLLDTLGIARAHVFGVSMGGMVAQELALGYPERVGALILGCTMAGGDGSPGLEKLRADVEAFHELSVVGAPSLDWFLEFLNHLWTADALRKSTTELQDFVLSLVRYPPTLHGLRAQACAIAAHDTYDRLASLRHRTLVVTADGDSLIAPENSEVLARRIPNADLAVFPGLKHAFHLEQPDAANQAIGEFIQDVRLAASGRSVNGSG